MDSSQDHGAALHGSSSCQVRCCTVQRPQCALLSAADHPRRAGVERSTSSTSSFIASTGTAAVGRKPPAQLRRRADATAGHMGPVVIRADLVVPPVSAEGDAVCVYRCIFFHFIDEYMPLFGGALVSGCTAALPACVPGSGARCSPSSSSVLLLVAVGPRPKSSCARNPTGSQPYGSDGLKRPVGTCAAVCGCYGVPARTSCVGLGHWVVLGRRWWLVITLLARGRRCGGAGRGHGCGARVEKGN